MAEQSYDELLRAGVRAAEAREFEEAEDLIERALELRPGDVPAMNMLGYIFWSRGDPAEGERYYRASLDIRPLDAHAHKGLGLALVDQGKIDEGIGEVKRAIDIRRNWGEPYYDLGVILTREKRWEEAWRLLDAAAKLDESLKARVEDVLPQVRANAQATAKKGS